MKLIRPVVIAARPGIITPMLGGIAGMLLMFATLMIGPVIGLPVIDIPRALGGVFFADRDTAFFFGFWVFFFGGALVFPIVFGLLWPVLRIGGTGFFSTVARGVIWGMMLWLLTGVVLWIAGFLNQLDARYLREPGFFALRLGMTAALTLLLVHVIY